MLALCSCALLLFALLQVVNVQSFCPASQISQVPSTALLATVTTDISTNLRRKIIQSALVTPLATATQPAFAAEKPPPIIPLVTTAKRLHAVPTFTIVDGNGVPFHTYDKDSAGGYGYFFTTYQSALYVLDDAKAAFAKAKEEAAKNKDKNTGAIGEEGTSDVPDAWGQAQIVTLPLDVVMQLSVKKTQSAAQNGKGNKFVTYYQVIPSTEDLNAALRIENSQRYSERGRVPLFFVDGLTISEDGAEVNPVYFRTKDLIAEWQKQYPDKEVPQIKVRELNETFRAMIRPGGKDTSVEKLVFVANPESVEKAKTCGRSYKLGEMILTK
ncbi:hypothetical protein ACHAWO_009858 [Cyclotella atomus]|jgi:hypothetical protein|uniref:Uncharacterized protein n=1 Tax=Cyclotella atomus TaxID=382360 RepID=A0ABD3QVD5_9STRA